MRNEELAAVAQLKNPAFYADPHPVYARLRREAPVFWYEPGQFWALSKYDDVKLVARTPEVFSSEQGITIGDNLKPDRGRGLLPPGAEGLVTTDPPRHNRLRRIVSKAFSPRMVAELEPRIREFVTQELDRFEDEGVIDFATRYAGLIPLLVMAEIMGVPKERQEAFSRWAEVCVASGDEQDEADTLAGYAVLLEAWSWFSERLNERRAAPGDDLISALVRAEIDGEGLSEANLLMFCLFLLAGGIETTTNLISGAVKALAEHPDQRERLVADPGLIPNAVDELLRWVSPVMTMGRTATHRTEIRGHTIETGDYVVMLYQSANRDEDVWDRPDDLLVSRETNPMHLALGFGEHLCLGAALARLEARVMFEEFLRRFPNYELDGEPGVHPSTFIRRTYSMPMKLLP